MGRMQQQDGIEVKPIEADNDVIVLQGSRIQVSVQDGALVCQDATWSGGPRAGLVYRASRLKRLIIEGTSGRITLDAIHWLAGVGTELTILDRNRKPLVIGLPRRPDYPALRRGQALAALRPEGLELVRELLLARLAGQVDILRNRVLLPEHLWDTGDRAAGEIERLAGELLRAPASYEAFQEQEAIAANLYWRVLQEVPLRFDARSRATIPPSWTVLGPRRSPLTGSPARAVTPGQAIMNYALAVAEGEIALACLAHGLDPGLGLMHTDRPASRNLVFDLLEAARAPVERAVLALLREQVFARRDFAQYEDGEVLIATPVRRRIPAILIDILRREADRLAARAAQVFAGVALHLGEPSSGLPEFASRRGEAGRQGSRMARRPGALRLPDVLERRCVSCGARVPDGRRHCVDCVREAGRTEEEAPSGGAEKEAARQERLSRAHAAIWKAQQAWEAAHGRDEAERLSRLWRDELFPAIQTQSLRQIARAAGVTVAAASAWRSGRTIPHPSRIEILAQWVASPHRAAADRNEEEPQRPPAPGAQEEDRRSPTPVEAQEPRRPGACPHGVEGGDSSCAHPR